MVIAYNVRDIDDLIFKKRKCFNKTNINARIILSAFKKNKQNMSKKILKILKLFFYFNKHIKEMNRFNALMIIYIN